MKKRYVKKRTYKKKTYKRKLKRKIKKLGTDNMITRKIILMHDLKELNSLN